MQQQQKILISILAIFTMQACVTGLDRGGASTGEQGGAPGVAAIKQELTTPYCSGPFTNTVGDHEDADRAYMVEEVDCSACWTGCWFPWGCEEEIRTYFASGSDEFLGDSASAEVTLYEDLTQGDGYFTQTECDVWCTEDSHCDDGDECTADKCKNDKCKNNEIPYCGPMAGTPDMDCTSATYDGHHYFFCENERDFDEARQRCQSVGMDLVQIGDQAEDEWILEVMDDLEGWFWADHYWIGASDEPQHGIWRWVPSGTIFWVGDPGQAYGGAYTNWEGGYPDWGIDGDCASKDPPIGHGYWETFECCEESSYICEQYFCADGQPPGPGGCGSSGGDDDGDGLDDDVDECPDNPEKFKPGECGCDLPDDDTDGDEVLDCDDECPLDPETSIEGKCGCPSDAAPAGTLCGDGLSPGLGTCDGAGTCDNGQEAAPCEDDAASCFYRPRRGKVYWFCGGPCATDRNQAAERCREKGGRLAQIDSAPDNALLARNLSSSRTWIGANDISTEGQWRWATPGGNDGTRFWNDDENGSTYHGAYANWATDQPSAGFGQDCAAMLDNDEEQGTWDDRSCGDELPYICEVHRKSGGCPDLTEDCCKRACDDQGNCVEDCHGDPPGFGMADVTDGGPCVPSSEVFGADEWPEIKAQMEECWNAVNPGDAGVDGGCNFFEDPGCQDHCQGAAALPDGTETCPRLDEGVEVGDYYCPLTEIFESADEPDGRPCYRHIDCASIGAEYVCGVKGECAGTGAACAVTDLGPSGGPRGEDLEIRTEQICGFLPDGGIRRCIAQMDMICEGCDPTTTDGGCSCSSHKDCSEDGGVPCITRGLCGTTTEECPATDPNEVPCAHYHLCEIPDGGIHDNIELTDASNVNEEVPFNPEEAFQPLAGPQDAGPTYPEEDPNPCGDPSQRKPDGGCNRGEAHPFCHYGLEDAGPSVNNINDPKHGNSGDSTVKFKFDPELNFDYEAAPGPLGILKLGLRAEAGIDSSVHIENLLGVTNTGFPIVDILLSLEAGLLSDIKTCGVSTAKSHVRLFGMDFTEEAGVTQWQLPPPDDQEQLERDCQHAYDNFVEHVNRAKKALKDAQKLHDGFVELITADPDANFGDPSLCMQVASDPVVDFPAEHSAGCENEPTEFTILRFIRYYNETVKDDLQAAAKKLVTTIDEALEPPSDADDRIPVGSLDDAEEATIFTSTFPVGPIPVNMEVLFTLKYGVNLEVEYKFAPGEIIEEVITNRFDVIPANDLAGTFAYVKVHGTPNVAAGIGLFVGVGFDIGVASAKAGIEGIVSLGKVALPTHAGAGLSLKSTTEPRPLPNYMTLNSLADQKTDRAGNYVDIVPRKTYSLYLVYDYGSEFELSDLLSGSVNVKVKISFLFFSKTWRATIVKFTGLCPPRPNGGPGSTAVQAWEAKWWWCNLEIFHGTDDEPLMPGAQVWGTTEMPMPLPRIQDEGYAFLSEVPADPGTAKFNAGAEIEEFFYDSLCTCIEEYDEVPDAGKKYVRGCHRHDDCCPDPTADPTDPTICWDDPAAPADAGVDAEVKLRCTNCREPGWSCNRDLDCCENIETSNFSDYNICKPNHDAGTEWPLCLPCTRWAQECEFDSDCCQKEGPRTCFDDPNPAAPEGGHCHDCRSEGQSCNTTNECCDENLARGCWYQPSLGYSICSDCREKGDECVGPDDCCEGQDLGCEYEDSEGKNICCLPIGASCIPDDEECCGESFCNDYGECCVPLGGSCSTWGWGPRCCAGDCFSGTCGIG